MTDLDLNINGDARRARAALNDVASGTERAARNTARLAHVFDNLEEEASEAQRALDRVQREIADTGPTAELNAELSRLQHRLSEIGDERRVTEGIRAEFRRASASAATLDNQLESVRRELDRLNDEYSQGGDPAVLRRLQEQQRELARLSSIRRRIQDEDENNQHRLARIAEEARRGQLRREDEDRQRAEDEDNRSFLRRLARRARNLAGGAGGGVPGPAVPPVPAPALAVGAAWGAAAAVPLISALGGALTGLVGTGVVGAGIAGAIMGDPEKFKAEWAGAADTLKSEFLDATAIFTGPTLEAIRGIGPLVQSWNLEEPFAAAAEYLPTIVHGVEGFATGIVRGVSAMAREGGPAVEGLSTGFAELGDAAGDALASIANGAEGGGEALRDILFVVGDGIRLFGNLVEAAEETYDFLHDHPIASALMSGGLSVPLSFLDLWSDKSDQVAGSVVDLGNAGSAAGGAIEDAWEGAAAAMQDYEDVLHDIVDTQLGLLDANIGWEQSLDDLTDSIKENGKNWDITTQKGRDNTQAVEDAYKAALDYRDAQVASGVQVGVANQALNAQIAYLEGIAIKAGMTKRQFDEMTAGLRNYLSLDANKTIRTTHIIEYKYVSGEGRIGDGSDPRTRPGSAYAEGGPVRGTGPMLVGERGPEVVWGSKDQFVSTAAQTRQLMSMMSRGGSSGGGGGGSGGGLTMRITGDTSGFLGQALAYGLNSGQIQIFDGDGRPVSARA